MCESFTEFVMPFFFTCVGCVLLALAFLIVMAALGKVK